MKLQHGSPFPSDRNRRRSKFHIVQLRPLDTFQMRLNRLKDLIDRDVMLLGSNGTETVRSALSIFEKGGDKMSIILYDFSGEDKFLSIDRSTSISLTLKATLFCNLTCYVSVY